MVTPWLPNSDSLLDSFETLRFASKVQRTRPLRSCCGDLSAKIAMAIHGQFRAKLTPRTMAMNHAVIKWKHPSREGPWAKYILWIIFAACWDHTIIQFRIRMILLIHDMGCSLIRMPHKPSKRCSRTRERPWKRRCAGCQVSLLDRSQHTTLPIEN